MKYCFCFYHRFRKNLETFRTSQQHEFVCCIHILELIDFYAYIPGKNRQKAHNTIQRNTTQHNTTQHNIMNMSFNDFLTNCQQQNLFNFFVFFYNF